MNHIRLLIRNQCGSHIIHGLPNPLAFQQNYSCYDGPSESGIFSPLDEPLLTSYLHHGITLICVNCLPRRIRCIAKLSVPTALLIGRNLEGSEISRPILRKYVKHQAHTGQTLHLNLMRE